MTVEGVDACNRRPFHSERIFGPIPGGSNENLRIGCVNRCDIKVGEIYPQPWCVLAETTALHRMRDHHARCRYLCRSSMAASIIVCVPPPEAPVIPIRVGSTCDKERRKSSARRLFHVCKPKRLIPHKASSASE